MKKIVTIFFLLSSFCLNINAQDIPIEKFIGVWQPTQDNWSSHAMKISQENGKIIVQVKNFIQGEARLNGNRLEITVVDEVYNGKYWVGRWSSSSPNDVLSDDSDGRCSYGEVDGFYSESYRRAKANKRIIYLSAHIVYTHEGTLTFYATDYSIYYDGNTPLFYQGREEDMYAFPNKPKIYTNW